MSTDRSELPDFSLVVPVHDEEANLEPLWGEIRVLFDALARPCEAIFVNDGSQDGSSGVLGRILESDARVRVIDHDRNHGLTAALDTGFRQARGRLVGMCDADMQNPPGELALLVEALEGSSCGVAIGWRRDRHDGFVRRASSRIANAYRNWRTREQVHDVGCGLKVFRREVLARIKLYKGLHRFLPTLARMEGFEIVEVPVAHRPRAAGRSHFGVWNRMWKGLRDVRTVRWMWTNRIAAKARERPRTGPEAP